MASSVGRYYGGRHCRNQPGATHVKEEKVCSLCVRMVGAVQALCSCHFSCITSTTWQPTNNFTNVFRSESFAGFLSVVEEARMLILRRATTKFSASVNHH